MYVQLRHTMTDIIVKHNSIVILAWLVFIGWGLLGYTLGVLLLYCTALLRTHRLFYGWLAGCAWFFGNLLFALIGALLWEEIYESYEEIESAPYIFVVLVLYIFSLYAWLYACYVCTHWKVLAYACAAFAFLASIVVVVATFITLHSTYWYHYLTTFLAFPPAFAFVATYMCVHATPPPPQQQPRKLTTTTVTTAYNTKFDV